MSKRLAIEDFGSFSVGGRMIEISGEPVRAIDTGKSEAKMPWDQNGRYLTDQMYVQYLIPQKRRGESVVFLHGGGLSGRTFETTPDGRPGWINHFAQAGFDVYNTDCPERGRAGFLPYPGFRNSEPEHFSYDKPLETMRIAASAGARADDPNLLLMPGCQFPLSHWEAFASQFCSFWLPMGQGVNQALSELRDRIGPFILITHSAGSKVGYGFTEAHPDAIVALISVEPVAAGAVPHVMRSIPQLIVWGDNIDQDPLGRWPTMRADVETYAKAVGTTAETLDLPTHGLMGNTHLPMMDLNSDDVARLLIDWLTDKLGTSVVSGS